MKNSILLILICSISISYAQNIKLTPIDINKFDLNGLWKITAREIYTDEGEITDSSHDKKAGVGDLISFNYKNKYFYAFTTLDVVNVIVDPIIKRKYVTEIPQKGGFYNIPNNQLPIIEIYKKGGDEPFFTALILNQNQLILFFDGNSSTFLTRELNNNSEDGWFVNSDGYFCMKGTYGYQTIILPENIKKNNSGNLDIRFKPQQNCVSKLAVSNLIGSDIEGKAIAQVSLKKIDNINSKIAFSIPLKHLKSNILKVEKTACDNNKEWEFEWRINDHFSSSMLDTTHRTNPNNNANISRSAYSADMENIQKVIDDVSANISKNTCSENIAAIKKVISDVNANFSNNACSANIAMIQKAMSDAEANIPNDICSADLATIKTAISNVNAIIEQLKENITKNNILSSQLKYTLIEEGLSLKTPEAITFEGKRKNDYFISINNSLIDTQPYLSYNLITNIKPSDNDTYIIVNNAPQSGELNLKDIIMKGFNDDLSIPSELKFSFSINAYAKDSSMKFISDEVKKLDRNSYKISGIYIIGKSYVKSSMILHIVPNTKDINSEKKFTAKGDLDTREIATYKFNGAKLNLSLTGFFE